MLHGVVEYVPNLELAEHNENVAVKDYELAAKLALQRDQHNPNWLQAKTRSRAVPNKNKSGHGPEHTEAISEDASRSFAKAVGDVLAGA